MNLEINAHYDFLEQPEIKCSDLEAFVRVVADAELQATSPTHYRAKTHPSRREVKHAINSYNVWYKISGRPD